MSEVIEAIHPSIFINDELVERGWSNLRLAAAMAGDVAINTVALDMYLLLGPTDPNIRLDSMAVDISRAFGVDDDLFTNLERAYLEALEQERRG